MKMTHATTLQSYQMYKKRILEINDQIIEALQKDDYAQIRKLRDVMSFMVDKYLKGIEYDKDE